MTRPMGDVGKKRGRGRPASEATPILVRVMPSEVFTLDSWISQQPDPKPSRPEAIRMALKAWLTGMGLVKHRDGPDGCSDVITGRQIREARELLDLSQARPAERCGSHPSGGNRRQARD